MRDRTEAAKILLDKGWTLEEVLKVLGEDQRIIINPVPMPYVVPCPVSPVRPIWYWQPDYTYCPTITTDRTTTTFVFTGESPTQILEAVQ